MPNGRLDISDGQLFYAVHAVAALDGNWFTHHALIEGAYFAGVVWC